MSRSYKKTPIFGITKAKSEKEDKRIANRALRANVRTILDSCDDYEDLIIPIIREVSNVWGFAKDGRRYCDLNKEWVRKEMRK